MAILERLLAKCKRNDATECLEWQGRVDEDGYGRLVLYKTHKRVHRIVWEEMNGPIANGLCVLHRCDNPPCCEITHLFLGTHQDNVADRVAKGRTARGDASGARRHPEKWARGNAHRSRLHPERMAHGERNGRAKLTEVQVREIRRRYTLGMGPRLAEEYQIGPAHLWQIATGKIWKHLLPKATKQTMDPEQGAPK